MKMRGIGAVALCAALAGTASGAVVYQQDFDQDTTQVVPASTNSEITSGTGWHLQAPTTLVGGIFGNVGEIHPAGSTESAGISADAAAPSNGHNTIASATTIAAPKQGNTPARIFFNGANTYNGILYTETTVDRSVFNLTSVTWYTRNNTGAGSRLALQVGGQWYASSLNFVDAADAGSIWTLRTDNLAAETFIPFTFTPGVALDQGITGLAQALPSGNITAFGLFLSHSTTNGNNRVDGFTLNGTVAPEPTTLGLITAGSTLVLRRRRK
jgi:hypothetical protein